MVQSERSGGRAGSRRVFTEPPRMLDRFELVLLFVLATIAVQGLIDVRGSIFAALFAHAITGLALIAAVRASGIHRRWRRAADVLVVAILVVSLAAVAWKRDEGTAAVPPATSWLIAAAITPVLIARRVLQHTVVTLQTIMGSVAAYLQIAVAYAFLFQTIDAFTTSQPFFGEDVPTTVYMYFSLVTISTVGFGDFVAVTSLGRLAAGSEAVIGQVFLVTFVALIVSRFAAAMPLGSRGRAGRGRTGEAGDDGEDGQDGEDAHPRTLQEAMSTHQAEPPPPPDPDDALDEIDQPDRVDQPDGVDPDRADPYRPDSTG